jgi:protein ImuA
MGLRSVSTILEEVGDSVWRADALAHAASAQGCARPSGHAGLDAQLPGGGWPVGALCEILQSPNHPCEWRLLLPALCQIAQKLVLIGQPHAPFGPALLAQGLDVHKLLWVKAVTPVERLWAAEQVLRSREVGAVLVWLPQVRSEHLRRLHLAAMSHTSLLFVMRLTAAQHESSPAVLRLLVAQASGADRLAGDGLVVQILKRRGPPMDTPLILPARHAALQALLAVDKRPLEQDHALDRLAADR